MNLSTQLRHFLSFLAGLGTMFLGWHIIAPEQVEAVNKAGAELISPLMVIIGAVGVCLFRLVIAKLGSFFARIGNKSSGGMSGGASLLVVGLGMAAGSGCLLPSCSPAQVAALRAIPIRTCVYGPDGGICYSRESGVEIQAILFSK